MENLLKLVYELGKNLKNPITIRQLSLDSKVPYTTTNRLIKQNQNIFKTEKKGNILLCSLNTNDKIITSYLALAERTIADRFCKKHKTISVIRSELPNGDYSVILFGSRAEEKNRKESDIDIIIINKDGQKTINFSEQEMLFKLKINPIFMKKKEFNDLLKNKEHNLTDEIIKKHIILKGEEFFWNLVIENGK